MAHDLHSGTGFGFECSDFPQAYSVFAAAGATCFERQFDNRFAEALDLGEFAGIAGLNQADDVKIAVANVTEEWCWERQILERCPGLPYTGR